MIGRWNPEHADVFVRDLLRDFCSVYAILTDQSQRFARSQTISYAVLRELLGEAMRKGVFWRLKDTAHHLFRKKKSGKRTYEGYGMGEAALPEVAQILDEDATPCTGHKCSEALVESMLDWCIGYAFHECSKLKEDAFQRQHYTNRLIQIKNRAEVHIDIIDALMPYTAQTKESIARELERILGVLEQTFQLLVMYLRTQGHNAALALYIATHEEFIQQQGHLEPLIQVMYAHDMGAFYLLAIKASLDGGHLQTALDIAEKAQEHLKDDSVAVENFERILQEYLDAYNNAQIKTILLED